MVRRRHVRARWLVVVSMLPLAVSCSKERRHHDDDEEEPARRAPTSASATQSAAPSASVATAQPSTSAPAGEPGSKRPPPIVTKTYRAMACRYGALSLKYARAAYLESLGGREPSATRIPSFGVEERSPSPTPPSGSPSASPPARSPKPTPGTPPPKTTSAVPVARFDRFIRSCNIGLSVKDAADPELDPVLKEFADFARPLARMLQEANAYYAQDKFKSDSFTQGRAYHLCLTGSGTCTPSSSSSSSPVTDAFARLDKQLLDLSAAVDRYRAAHPIDKSGFSPPRRLGNDAVEDANALLVALDTSDLVTASSSIAKLEATKTALEGLTGTTEDAHAWGKGLTPPLKLLIDRAKDLASKGKTPIPPAQMNELVALHARVLERDYSSLQRALRGPPSTRIPTARMPRPEPSGPPLDDAPDPDSP